MRVPTHLFVLRWAAAIGLVILPFSVLITIPLSSASVVVPIGSPDCSLISDTPSSCRGEITHASEPVKEGCASELVRAGCEAKSRCTAESKQTPEACPIMRGCVCLGLGDVTVDVHFLIAPEPFAVAGALVQVPVVDVPTRCIRPPVPPPKLS